MAVTTLNQVLSRVSTLLVDTDHIRWRPAELVDYFNDAQLAIVNRRPDSHCEDVDDFSCQAGTKQRLPAKALRLIDVPRNRSGRAIKGPFARQILDDNYPYWYRGNTASEAEVFVYDQRNPKTFYLYPGVVAKTVITAVYSTAPTPLSEDDIKKDPPIALDDCYLNAIVEWMLYRCFMKDAEYAANREKSQMHLAAFKTQLGEKSEADGAMAGIQAD